MALPSEPREDSVAVFPMELATAAAAATAVREVEWRLGAAVIVLCTAEVLPPLLLLCCAMTRLRVKMLSMKSSRG